MVSDRPSMSQVIKWTASKVPDAATWRDSLNEAERIILAFAESYWRDRIAQEIEACLGLCDHCASLAARVVSGASPVPTEPKENP